MTSRSFAIPNSAQPASPYSWRGAPVAGTSLCGHITVDMSCGKAPVVYVVDDDPSTRGLLERLIGAAGWRAQCFSLAADFLSHGRTSSPACVVLAASLPDMPGLDVQERLTASENPLPIVMVDAAVDVVTAVRAMKAGALDFMTKPLDAQTLVEAVRRAIESSRTALKEQTEIQALQQRFDLLTPREQEVMLGVVAGRSNRQVAADLGISEITVKAHRSRLMKKMEAPSLPDLVRMAARIVSGA